MNDEGAIPEELKPIFEANCSALAEMAVKRQERSDFELEWIAKSISIEDVDKFLGAHGKSGIVMFYWDLTDEGSKVTIQSLNVGKTRADQIMGSMIRSAMRNIGLA
jgi:hypothetical protein